MSRASRFCLLLALCVALGALVPAAWAVPNVVSTMGASLQVDADTSSSVTPGDTLRYAVALTTLTEAALGARFELLVANNASLVVGSVTHDQGSVTTGNTAGDTSVVIDLGTLNVGGPVNLGFDLLVDDPFPNGQTSVSAQGFVTASTMTIKPTNGGSPTVTAVVVPTLTATMSDALLVDGNGNGAVDPGDTLEYTVEIAEIGGVPAPNLAFSLPVVAQTSLVVGSVTATVGGVVTTGNTAGDSTVLVDVASLPASGGVTVTFALLVDSPVTPGTTEIVAQGQVASEDLAAFLTSDPDEELEASPTRTPLADATLVATMTDAVVVDGDADGSADPGDTVRYTVVLKETSGVAAGGVTVALTPSGDSALVVGSVGTSQGSAVTGNTGGDTTVLVDVGTVAGLATVTLTVDVLVDSPFTGGADQFAAQGVIQASGLPDVFTDDPDEPGSGDATITPVDTGATPDVQVSMADTLQVDPGADGVVNPGDTIRYTVLVSERAGTTAKQAVFALGAIAETALVVGSVTTSRGSVTTGNTGGDTTVQVALGDLPGGSVTTITFDLLVDSGSVASQVSAQGNLSGTGFAVVLTADPAGGGPTVTPLEAAGPRAAMVVALFADISPPPGVGPGDFLRYTVTLTKSGAADATNVVFIQEAIPETVLQPALGTVTSQGTVTEGSVAGHTRVEVAVGTMTSASGPVTINFVVRIANPPTAGTTRITAQGSVTSDAPTVSTDDPGLPGAAEPTVILFAGVTPALTATLTDALQVDGGTPGQVDPGDTLRYTVVITEANGVAADDTTFTIGPIPETSLVVGSVTTTQGSVTTGNGGGDTSVLVDLETLGASGSATITFDVVVADPVTGGVTQLSAQGAVSATDVAEFPTDDPDVGGAADPTLTDLLIPGVLADVVATMADSPSGVDPGGTITYTVVLIERAGVLATGTMFSIGPFVDSTLVAGTVTTSQGSVTTGNTGGDTTVLVDVGTLAASGTATITFQVQVADPLIVNPLQVSAQGSVSGDNFPTALTGDLPGGGPTLTPISAPALSASLIDVLQVDADGSGTFSPGDTVRYTMTLTQSGGPDALGTQFTQSAIADTTLVVGSVTTSRGSVSTGNGGGDTSVLVDIGTSTTATSPVTVSFDVLIDDPILTGAGQLVAQGAISASNSLGVQTDDPAAGGAADATESLLVYTRPQATLVDSLVTDLNADGNADPGDTLSYTMTLTVTGTLANTGVSFALTPDPDTDLVVGSVTTTKGLVTTGNLAGNTSVGVSIGTLTLLDTTVTITFRVTVKSPLSPAITQVSQQGTVTSNAHPPLSTDDPAAGGAADATVTPVLRPVLTATLTDALLLDVGADGLPSAGDSVRYTVEVTNTGSQDAAAVVFTLAPDANTALIAGSVTTTQGSVTTGNGGGDSSVAVALGTLVPAGAATVTFDVVLASPLPPGLTQLSTQGVVSGTGLTPLVTDDPDTGAPDATLTSLLPAPRVGATLVAAVAIDLGGDGKLSPGDTLGYTIMVTNTGNVTATAMTVAVTSDPASALVTGTVTTTQGVVTQGNGPGDTRLLVDAGDLPVGVVLTVTYSVTAATPFPVGVDRVSEQGTISGSNFADVPTDDPATGPVGDPTVTFLEALLAALPGGGGGGGGCAAGGPAGGAGPLALMVLLCLGRCLRLRRRASPPGG